MWQARPRGDSPFARARIIGGMARDLIEETQALHAAVIPWTEDPREDRLRRARRALQMLLLAWKRAYAFQPGRWPSATLFRTWLFGQQSRLSIDAVLASGSPIDKARIEQLGVDTRGLFALEYLLFSGAASESSQSGASSDSTRADRLGNERVRAYARELSFQLLGYAARIARLLGDGGD